MTDTRQGRQYAAGEPVTLIVGPGDRFLSGVSYYSALLTAALAERGPVAVLLLRELCPRALYPGRGRVGSTDGMLPLPKVPIFNGLNWFWGRSALDALRFWRGIVPSVVVLQWWTATVLHSYVLLAWFAKRAGVRVVVEFHEIQDVGEAKLPVVGRYTRLGMRLLLNHVDAAVVHSEYDRREVQRVYPQVADIPTEVIPHGPFPQYGPIVDAMAPADQPHPTQSDGPVRLLIFGVVRPYKGHADLVEAVRLLRNWEVDVHLSVVGEVWQNYREPLDELSSILREDRLVIVDRYVADDEVAQYFAAADLVVLPYRRSSASGPLHIAMSYGLPVVTTSVGGLVEAAIDYTGAVFVPPADPVSLAKGIRAALPLIGRTHVDPHSWRRSADRYADLLHRLDVPWGLHTAEGRLVESIGSPGGAA